jgi:carboxymethylenebutenolidase
MRTQLPSGTPAEIATCDEPTMGLVVAPDIWSLRPLYDEMCARLADEWHMNVVAVEPFPDAYRDLPMELEPRWDAVADLDDAHRLRDFQEAAAATGCERVGMIGFCLGGMYVNKSASLDRFDRLVSFYGMIRVPPHALSEHHREPLELIDAANGGHPDRLLAIVGGKDPYTPPADIAALAALGVETVEYPEADHAFVHDPARDTHRADDAADAWARCLAWLRS